VGEIFVVPNTGQKPSGRKRSGVSSPARPSSAGTRSVVWNSPAAKSRALLK
jgi:hypothetical protein